MDRSLAAKFAKPRRRLGSRLRDGNLWLSAVLIVLFLCLVAPPIVTLVDTSLRESALDGSKTAFTLEHYTGLLSRPGFYLSAWNSIVFASFSTLFALLIGGGVAWLVERTNAPLGVLAHVTVIVSLSMPVILYVLAWMFILGRTGPLNDMIFALTGDGDIRFNVNSMVGMVLIESFLWQPFVFLLFSATFRASNADMEEAARMSGAGVVMTLWRISLGLARPAILATTLFVFVRTLEAFDVPVLVGWPAGIYLLTSDVYFSVLAIPPQIGHASAFSVVLTVLIAVLMYFYSRISRRADRYATVTGKGYRPRRMELGRGRWIGGGLIFLYFAIVLAVPLLALGWASIMPFLQSIRFSSLPLATLGNYVAVFQQPAYLRLALNTLIVAGAAATIAMGITLAAGWVVARRRAGATIIDQLTTLPLLLPGIVLAIAMMQIAFLSPLPLYGSLWIIVIAFVVRYMPYGMRYSFNGVLQIHRELEEAASVAGASTFKVLSRIVAPLLVPALASGWLFVFLNAAKELSIPIILAGPRSQTMAVAIFEQSVNGQFTELAALGLVWTGFMSIFAICLYILLRRLSLD